MNFQYTKNNLDDQSSPRYCLYLYAKFCKIISSDYFNHDLSEWKLTSKHWIKILFTWETFSLIKRFLILAVFFLALFLCAKYTWKLAFITLNKCFTDISQGFLAKVLLFFQGWWKVKSVAFAREITMMFTHQHFISL